MKETIQNPYSKVLITGANGFIGKALVNWYQQNGSEVIGVDLQANTKTGVIKGDITRAREWSHLLNGVELVINTAAIVSFVAERIHAWRVNTQAVATLIDLAKEHGVKRFCHFSSAAAYGYDCPENADETYPVRANGNTYTDTKIAAEHAAMARHIQGGIQVTLIRPTDVYGYGSRPWIDLPLQYLRDGSFMLPKGGNYVFSPIYIDDLVRGVSSAANSPNGTGQIFNIAGGIETPLVEYFSYHNRWLRNPKPLKMIDHRLASILAEANFRIYKFLGKETQMSAKTIRALTRSNGFSIEKARKLLDWQPQVPLEQGMKITEDKLRENGQID